MVDNLYITYSIGATLSKSHDEEAVEGTVYYKWDYQAISYPDPAASPFDEAWFEKDEETGTYALTDDISVDPETVYYTYELVPQTPGENDNPSELGWLVVSEPEEIGEPSSTMELVYDV